MNEHWNPRRKDPQATLIARVLVGAVVGVISAAVLIWSFAQ